MECAKQLAVTVGTIFQDSHVPISKWLMAIFILCSSRKAVSSHQLHRMLGVTYKTAWFMMHRLRYAMQPDQPLGKLLEGTVVNHYIQQYARHNKDGTVSGVNSCRSFFSLLKRGVYGARQRQ
jgi:hypothetical protein